MAEMLWMENQESSLAWRAKRSNYLLLFKKHYEGNNSYRSQG